MKQAKVLLTALGVFAVVGAAMALKVRNESTFYRADPANGQCSVSLTLQSTVTTDLENPNATTTRLSTAPTQAACPQITIMPSI